MDIKDIVEIYNLPKRNIDGSYTQAELKELYWCGQNGYICVYDKELHLMKAYSPDDNYYHFGGFYFFVVLPYQSKKCPKKKYDLKGVEVLRIPDEYELPPITEETIANYWKFQGLLEIDYYKQKNELLGKDYSFEMMREPTECQVGREL